MSERGARGPARAAWLLAVGLGAAVLAPGRADPPCAEAAEARVRGEWTSEVVCGGAGGELRGPARLLFGAGVDPNRADAATLETLPGVGPARAAAWIRERSIRPFCAVVDLQRVKGIGPKTSRALRPWLEFHEISGCGNGS